MARYAIISREQFRSKKWSRPRGYKYIANASFAPIVLAEMTKAALTLPLAFMKQGDGFILGAVLSMAPERNMFVGPDGAWLGQIIPAAFRGYPFALTPKADSQEMILCVDEASGLLSDTEGEPFFDAEGNAMASFKAIMDFLLALHQSRIATELSVAVLGQSGVIIPWPIKIRTDKGEQTMEGLFRVDEQALTSLADDAYLKLRGSAALSIAYAQLFSMQNLQVFEHLEKFHAQKSPKPVAPLPDNLDKLFDFSDNREIRFD